jgi:polysaccharide pyruvyl transferase WcaK-like protein
MDVSAMPSHMSLPPGGVSAPRPDRFDAILDARAAVDGPWLTELVATGRTHLSAGQSVRWHIPLVSELVYRLETLFSLAQDEGFDPVLLDAPAGIGALGQLSNDEKLFAWDFIAYRLLEGEGASLSGERIGHYRTLQTKLGFPASRATSPSADLADVGLQGIRALWHWVATRGRESAPADRMSRVLVIGAYGGEHIGDAAILGGVLLRIHRRYGVTRAILMTQRPAHTRHLMPMLDLPVEITVELYEPAQVRHSLKQVDGVVFGGGPLTDLPKQLVRHLYTVSLAVRSGKPFVVEGVGAGPFVRGVSEWVARRLVKMATRVSVRTAHDSRQPLVRDLSPVAGRDPAFDYLDTRVGELTRLRHVDQEWIDRLLRDTEGRLLVGVNLRPIRHLFTEGPGGQDRAEYTRMAESRFEERFAEGLKMFAADKPACFVFYPMNAIQFGMSDLRSAYRVQRLLAGAVDFRIWEADASIDGVIALLRRLDIVIAMRFHAAIYALAHTQRVVGIDYRIGKKDKVGALLEDFGLSENCQRIDELTSEWLCARLSELASAPGGHAQ